MGIDLFPHYVAMSKLKEMRSRLGWTISYKSLYVVHPSLDLTPLFTGMWERSIQSQNFQNGNKDLIPRVMVAISFVLLMTNNANVRRRTKIQMSQP